MSKSTARLTTFYAATGHMFMHMFAAFYFVIVLAIEDDWQFSYDELINLYEILDKDDDVIFKWYSNKNTNDSIPINKVSDLLKKFRLK